MWCFFWFCTLNSRYFYSFFLYLKLSKKITTYRVNAANYGLFLFHSFSLVEWINWMDQSNLDLSSQFSFHKIKCAYSSTFSEACIISLLFLPLSPSRTHKLNLQCNSFSFSLYLLVQYTAHNILLFSKNNSEKV